MQNMDFYNGKNYSNSEQRNGRQERHDPEYFARMSKIHAKEDHKIRKKASRVIFIIASLCIVSFTTGLAIGIKFAGGNGKQIVDEKTFNAVKGLSSKVSNMFNRNNTEKFKVEQFPKNQYPFVIKVGGKYEYTDSQKIANFLSKNGHTVIISKNNSKFNIYTGPYKNQDDADNTLKKFSSYDQFSLASAGKIIKRN